MPTSLSPKIAHNESASERRLSAPLRGVVYGIALVLGAPLAWSRSPWIAGGIAGLAVVGMGVEVWIYHRHAPR